MDIYRIRGTGAPNDTGVVNLRCPHCHQRGTFEALNAKDVKAATFEGTNNSYVIGHRRCPDPDCGAVVFFVRNYGGELLATFPAEKIDFDAINVPASVIRAMEEAIACHANECLTASAIMVRKTLEELCKDRNASGRNLKERIKDLGSKVVLPQELLDGLDDLRLLGNDAAHIESQEFNKVGQEEVEIGIEFTKEVLKATYQYSALLSRLRSLKKSTS